jgi:hypothetical protein
MSSTEKTITDSKESSIYKMLFTGVRTYFN